MKITKLNVIFVIILLKVPITNPFKLSDKSDSGDRQDDQINLIKDFVNDFPYNERSSQTNRRSQQQYAFESISYTREMHTKKGTVQGVVKRHTGNMLPNIEQYLGIAYAEAPVGSRRFMPPGEPLPIQGSYKATKLQPVCPQILPNLDSSKNRYSEGRIKQLKRLIPYLRNQSEDCLYLNLYVPSLGHLKNNPKFPVVVFIHGESYEWNSGNPYDGSVLASYGGVIVITLNYRLGAFGFMKPDTREQTVSNFGLLDQIAALQWIKDNIDIFHGDRNSVTLMGHGTGAACVNFLMISPIAQTLFHRAILMSGSALADSAVATQSAAVTVTIGNKLNCPLNDEDIAECLRTASIQDIFKAIPMFPEYSIPFGPVIGDVVIPNEPDETMNYDEGYFGEYDLLFGVTEIESYHSLNNIGLLKGLLESERNSTLQFYMQNRFDNPALAVEYTLRKYDPVHRADYLEDNRDILLDILSDARVVAPLMQTGIYHSKVNPRTYMYVFGHNSQYGDFPRLQQSIVGEELPYVFGAPLGATGPFPTSYTDHEKFFSLAMMEYWSNFAKTGNPKAPWKEKFANLEQRNQWMPYDIDWHEFSHVSKQYLNLGIPPAGGLKYRDTYIDFWNNELPKRLTKDDVQPSPSFVGVLSSTETSSSPFQSSVWGSMNLMPKNTNYHPTENPFDRIRIINDRKQSSNRGGNDLMHNYKNTDDFEKTDEDVAVTATDSSFYILIAVVVIFFAVNVLILFLYLWKKTNRLRKIIRIYDETTNVDGATDDEVKRPKLNETDDSFIMDIVRKSNGNNTYEPVKTSYSPISGFKMSRQCSTSTVDPHTKVVDWIAHEIVKYSPKITKKFSFAETSRKLLGKPKKVSIAIDATPYERSDSVLRQEPIEITKAKSFGNGMVSNANLIESNEDESSEDNSNSPSSGTGTSSGSSEIVQNEIAQVRINHKHSHSDPVEMLYHKKSLFENVTSFIDGSNVNVTSRDSQDSEPKFMTPEEALIRLQRRNYPKVLPDFPDDDDVGTTIKRRSLPAHTFLPNSCSVHNSNIYRMPPAPPPRTTSTLGRKSSNRRRSNNITTSPLMLAEEPPDVQEPEITLNTLHVGPLIPKFEGIYSNVKHKNSLTDSSDSSQYSDTSLLNDRKTAFLSKLKEPDKIEPKIIIKPTVRQPCGTSTDNRHNNSNIPRVQIKDDYATSVRPEVVKVAAIRAPSDSSSSNDTQSSAETVKPNTAINK